MVKSTPNFVYACKSSDSEGFVRSSIDQILSQQMLVQFSQLPSFQELMTALQATHLAPAFTHEITSQNTDKLHSRLEQLLADQLNEIQIESESDVYDLITLLKAKYQILNVFTIINSFGQGVQTYLSPLGEDSTITALQSAQDLDTLYLAILENLPVSQYFQSALITVDELKATKQDYAQLFNIQNKVMNELYQSIYDYINTRCNEASYQSLLQLFDFDCDSSNILIKLSTMNQTSTSKPFYFKHGQLYPFFIDEFESVSDIDSLIQLLTPYQEYRQVLQNFVQQTKQISCQELFQQAKREIITYSINQQFNISFIVCWLEMRIQENAEVEFMVDGFSYGCSDKIRQQLK